MRNLTRLVFVGALLLMFVPSRGAVNPKEFRIGYQKAANTLVLLKAHRTLEQRLRPLGIESLFPRGSRFAMLLLPAIR